MRFQVTKNQAVVNDTDDAVVAGLVFDRTIKAIDTDKVILEQVELKDFEAKTFVRITLEVGTL